VIHRPPALNSHIPQGIIIALQESNL
jgi:hypothetical protein